MLKSLLKYDLKKPLLFLTIFYSISLILSIITRLLSLGNELQIFQILTSIFKGLTYSAICSLLVNTFIQIISRFYKSLFKDQGYLTHTLPVSKEQILLSKFLSSLIIVLISIIVSVLSLFIMLYSPEFMQSLNNVFTSTIPGFNISVGLIIFLIILILLTELCALLSLTFLSYIKGNYYNLKRGLKGFRCFIINYLIYEFTIVVIAVIVGAIMGNLNNLFSESLSQSTFMSLLIIALVVNIIYSFVFYYLCLKQFKKGVNID